MSLVEHSEKGFSKAVAEDLQKGEPPSHIAEALEVAKIPEIVGMLQTGQPNPALLEEGFSDLGAMPVPETHMGIMEMSSQQQSIPANYYAPRPIKKNKAN